MLNDILWPDPIQWQPPTDQISYRTRPLTEFWVISIEHLRRVWHADRGRLLLRTPGLVPLGLAYVLLVETNPFSELVVTFPDYALRISLGTFSILLCHSFLRIFPRVLLKRALCGYPKKKQKKTVTNVLSFSTLNRIYNVPTYMYQQMLKIASMHKSHFHTSNGIFYFSL